MAHQGPRKDGASRYPASTHGLLFPDDSPPTPHQPSVSQAKMRTQCEIKARRPVVLSFQPEARTQAPRPAWPTGTGGVPRPRHPTPTRPQLVCPWPPVTH